MLHATEMQKVHILNIEMQQPLDCWPASGMNPPFLANFNNLISGGYITSIDFFQLKFRHI